MSDEGKFFQTERVQNSLKRAVALVTDAPSSESSRNARDVGVLITDIYRFPETYDEYCPTSIRVLGDSVVSALDGLEAASRGDWKYLFALLYRFVGELLIRYPGEVPLPIRALYEAIPNRLDEFDERQKWLIQWTLHHLPRDLAAELVNHPSVTELKRGASSIAKLANLNDFIEASLNDRNARVDALAASLKRLESEYNFVGLAHGFEAIEKTKRLEWRVTFAIMILLGLVMLTPLILEAIYIFNLIVEKNTVGLNSIWFLAPAAIAFEVILVYFFRIALARVRSLDAQLIQLRLRMALCQFIESYAEYAEVLKKRSDVTLGKFENIIFSALQTSEERIPSTFDGMEQLMKLVQQFRGAEIKPAK